MNEKAPSKPALKEFFSFWCPACYSFEPLVKKIKEGLGEDVKFTKKIGQNVIKRLGLGVAGVDFIHPK